MTPWTTQSKDISITSTTDHPSNNAALIGRPPGVTNIQFTPAEFFGAAARCCYSNVINPALVTPESVMIKSLVEQHVDDGKANFSIEPSADDFVDYAKSFFAGTVAAGLAYLAMIKDGYTWSDHFKNIGGGNSNVRRSPDFVFARHGYGDVALVESKGTRSGTAGAFDSTVDDGYRKQVEPHLGYLIGAATATHGYCIGSYLTSPTRGELNVHYTDLVTVSPSSGASAGPGSTASVQRHNYATAFLLAHSESLAQQIRRGHIEDGTIPFAYFDWLGRRWITAPLGMTFADIGELGSLLNQTPWRFTGVPRSWQAPSFAIESTYAATVLRTLSPRVPERFELGFDLTPMPESLRREADRETSGGAAIFPDGLAVFIRGAITEKKQPIVWLRDKGDFVSVQQWQSLNMQKAAQQLQAQTYGYLTSG
jgi:hypothetical protein